MPSSSSQVCPSGFNRSELLGALPLLQHGNDKCVDEKCSLLVKQHPAANAGIIAAQIIGAFDNAVQIKLQAYKVELRTKVEESVATIDKNGFRSLLK